MCKYCEYDMSRPEIGEYANSIPSIGKLKIGKLYVELALNRYEHDDTQHKELIMYLNADTDSGYTIIDEKHIKIKYCPFCGEKL